MLYLNDRVRMFFYCIINILKRLWSILQLCLEKYHFTWRLKYQITIKYYSWSSLLPPAQQVVLIKKGKMKTTFVKNAVVQRKKQKMNTTFVKIAVVHKKSDSQRRHLLIKNTVVFSKKWKTTLTTPTTVCFLERPYPHPWSWI